MTLPSISVVIPTQGRPRQLERTLRAALADPATSEAVVVTDGVDEPAERVVASLGSADHRLRLARFPRANGQPVGRAQEARRRGVELASSEVVLALDDDVVAAPGLVTGHASRHARAADDLVVLGYMPVRKPHGGGERAAARIYREGYERACIRYREDPKSILRGLWAGNFSIRRARWLAVPAVLPGEADYHADRQFGLLLEAAGLKGVFEPSLRAEHWFERTTSQFLEGARQMAVDDARQRALFGELVTDPGPRAATARSRVAAMARRVPPGLSGPLARGLAGAAQTASHLRLHVVEYYAVRLACRLVYEGAAHAHDVGGHMHAQPRA